MDDLRRRFASLDAVAAPDLWGDVQRRVAAPATDRVGGAIRARGVQGRPLPLLVALALLLVAVVVAALVAGSQRDQLPTVVLPPDDASPAPATTPVVGDVASTGLVVYSLDERWRDIEGCDVRPWRCMRSRLWIAAADGSDAHPLLRDSVNGNVVGWMPDGSGVLYMDEFGAFRVVAPDGTEVGSLGTFDTLCDPTCTGIESVAISPDGTRIAFAAIRSPESGDTSVIAIFDITSGQTRELASTATRTDGMYCDSAADEGMADPPIWSPDGTRLAFVRQLVGPPIEGSTCGSALYVVNADGSDLLGIVPMDLHPLAPQWSPDGSVIAFHSATRNADGQSERIDIYTIRPDGTALRRLTEDGAAAWPTWTRNGRLIFVRPRGGAVTTVDPWIMDVDGGNAEPIARDDLASLSAVGCLRCPFPSEPGLRAAFWQPS